MGRGLIELLRYLKFKSSKRKKQSQCPYALTLTGFTGGSHDTGAIGKWDQFLQQGSLSQENGTCFASRIFRNQPTYNACLQHRFQILKSAKKGRCKIQ